VANLVFVVTTICTRTSIPLIVTMKIEPMIMITRVIHILKEIDLTEIETIPSMIILDLDKIDMDQIEIDTKKRVDPDEIKIDTNQTESDMMIEGKRMNMTPAVDILTDHQQIDLVLILLRLENFMEFSTSYLIFIYFQQGCQTHLKTW